MTKPTDIAVRDVRIALHEHLYRSPIKFGGVVNDRATSLDVVVRVERPDRREADGFGSMTLGNTWSFPSSRLASDRTLAVMKALAGRAARLVRDVCGAEHRHPIDHGLEFERALVHESDALAKEMALPEPVPRLCSLVVGSPFDAAIHDAFGKVNGFHCYEGYGAKFVTNDLAHYLDGDFAGEFLDAYTLRRPRSRLPLYHLVGALDPLTDAEVSKRINDGLPETLEEWMLADGLTHLKIKLNGDDREWDIGRALAVDGVAAGIEAEHGERQWRYSLDFNERCPNVEYLIEVLAKVRERAPRAFERIQYVEQPTARDLRANPANRMHAARDFKPIVIDESLVDYESLRLAEEMGYSGVALKACKGQSQSLLLAAAAQKRKLFVCVQDLTCVGAAFLHSAGLAAHVPAVAAVEGNGRQYCPAANAGWDELFPTTFEAWEGMIETGVLTGPGLGCVPPGRERECLGAAPRAAAQNEDEDNR